jgi:dTDP-4-dehydrorhamnose 3,5-epimerase
MIISKTKIDGLKIVKQVKFKDPRGSLRVMYNKKILKSKNFVFNFCTTSKKNVLRGFHFQSKFQQAKFVNVVKGKIMDCVVDLRKNSKTFGKTFKIILSDKNSTGLYIPEGFGHAYYSYEKINIIYYQLSDYYKPNFENGIIWNDKKINVSWPTIKPLVSKKDKMLLTLDEFKAKYKYL